MLNSDLDFKHVANQFVGDRSFGNVIGGNSAAMDDDNAVREADREVEVMQDCDDSGAIARASAGDLDKFDLMAQVQAGGRFVQQQQSGPVLGFAASKLHENACKMCALLLAA